MVSRPGSKQNPEYWTKQEYLEQTIDPFTMLHHVSVLENFRRLGGDCLFSSPHCHLPSESMNEFQVSFSQRFRFWHCFFSKILLRICSHNSDAVRVVEVVRVALQKLVVIGGGG